MGLLRSWLSFLEFPLGPLPLKALGTHHVKRCEGPASQGKRVHFGEGRKNVLRSLQKILLEGPETRRATVRPKQNTRSPQGGGRGPKQCPGDGRGMERGDQYRQSRAEEKYQNGGFQYESER